MLDQLLGSLGWRELPLLMVAAVLGIVFFLVIRQNRKDLVLFTQDLLVLQDKGGATPNGEFNRSPPRR